MAAFYNRWRGVLLTLSTATALTLLVSMALIAYFDTSTVVLVIRHAEKAAAPPDDPPLTADGHTRAQTLVHVVGTAGINAIYATEYARTQQTVDPLASDLGLPPHVWQMSDWQGLVQDIRSHHRGQIVLVCAHSTTVHHIVNELSGASEPQLSETQYDHLYIVVVPRWSPARVVHLKYGQPTS